MSIKIRWHGHGTFSVQTSKHHLIIDPFLKGKNPVAQVSPEELDVDYILITHGHMDHVADAMSMAQRCNAMIIANAEIADWFEEKGAPRTHAQHIGGGYQHPFGHLKLTPAFHGSVLPDGSNGGMPTGILLTLEGKKLYFAGDTGLFSDMSLIGRGGLDVAVLPIGDNYTMGPEDALEAVKFLQPQVVIPCHYNTFPLLAVDEQAWAERVNAETTARAVVLAVEGVYEF
jgi:L-ascorbate metabolism protein UlaG (beta-lactamase superfamily)